MDTIDLINSFPVSKQIFVINPALWDSFETKILDVINTEWTEVKLWDQGRNPHTTLNSIPNNSGGIYVFIAKPDIIPLSHLYLLYIGRAQYTENQNLRKRCKEYVGEQKRPKIKRMLDTWGKYLYIRYLPLENNEIITAVEEELINKIIPPFNDQIPNKDIRDYVNAWAM